MSKSMPIFEEDDELKLVKSYIKQVPTITSKFVIAYNSDVPALKTLVSDVKTLSNSWSDPPDFHALINFLPILGNALMTDGAITGTLTPYGKFFEDATSWKEFSGIYHQLTFSKGTYGGIKKIRFHPAKFPYQVVVYAKKAGNTYNWQAVVEPQDKTLEYSGYYMDDDGTHDLEVKIYYYESSLAVLGGNVYENDAGNYGVLTRALSDKVMVSFDMYNEFDKGYLPSAISSLSSLDETAIDIVEDFPDTLIAATAMGINDRDLAISLVKALTYADDQGWLAMSEILNNANKLSVLLGKVTGAYLYLTKEQTFADVAIPDHFDAMLDTLRRSKGNTKDYTLICALVGAIDDIFLITRPAS